MKPSIWARAWVIFASSTFLKRAGPTKATNRPMMVTTTSISIKVTPAWERRRERLSGCVILHRHVVNAGNCKQHTENQGADQNSHDENHGRLKNRGKAPDG